MLAALEKGIPDHERVIALDRVLANIDHSQIVPRNVEGVKADPPTIYYSTRPAILVELRRRSGLESDPGQRSEVRGQHELGCLPARADEDVSICVTSVIWLKASERQGTVDARRTRCPPASRNCPTDDNWKDVKASLPGADRAHGDARRLRQHGAGGTDPAAQGVPAYSAGARHPPAVGEQHRQRRVPARRQRARCTSSSPAAGSRRPTSPARGRSRRSKLPADFKKISLEHPRSRVLASVPGTPQAAEAVLLAQVPQTARVNRKELQGTGGRLSGRAAVPADRADDGVARGQHRQGHHQGRRPSTTCASRACGSWPATRQRTVGSHRYGAEARFTRFPPARPRTTSPTSPSSRDDDDEWVTYAAVAGYTGMMVGVGLRGVGHRLVLPAVRVVRRLLSGLLPVLSDLRIRRLVQPVDRRLRPRRGVVRTVRRRGSRGALQPVDRHLRARRRRMGTGRRTRRRRRRTTRAPGTYARTQQGSGVYGSWGATSVQRGNQWAQTARVTNRVTGTTTRATQGSGGGAAVTRPRSGRHAVASCAPAAATSMPAATATSIDVRTTAAGRNTTAVRGDRARSRRLAMARPPRDRTPA